MIKSPTTAEAIREQIHRLRAGADRLRITANAELFAILDRAGSRWQPGGELFQAALEMLRGTFSEKAVRAALENLAISLKSEVIRSQLARELGRADLLEAWSADEIGCGLYRGYPLGVVAQVLAGNVFLNGIVGLSQCLLTKNAALLKISSRDSGLTAMFAEALLEADPDGLLTDCLAICTWSRNRDDLNQVLRDEADGIVVWGGTSAMEAYPAEKCRGRVVHYGPRLGLGIVAKEFGTVAELDQLAWDIAIWEQQACSSPRMLFVEDAHGGRQHSRAIAKGLSEALARIAKDIPPQELSLDDKTEVLSIRETADWQGHSVLAETDSMAHTVILLDGLPEEIPIGYRTVLIVPISSMKDIPEKLLPYRDVLQTAVVAAPAERWPDIVDSLAQAGITQVTAPGSAASRFLGLPHEGEFSLRRLVKLVGADLGFGPLTAPIRSPEDLAKIAQSLDGSQ